MRRSCRLLPVLVGLVFTVPGATGQTAPPSVRLYVFDCGSYPIADLGRFRLEKEEVATSDLSIACFLVAHPKGTLMWGHGRRSG